MCKAAKSHLRVVGAPTFLNKLVSTSRVLIIWSASRTAEDTVPGCGHGLDKLKVDNHGTDVGGISWNNFATS